MTHWAYNRYVSALTRPVRYRSRTGLETATGRIKSARKVGKLSGWMNETSSRNCPLASPGGVAERSESFKIMIAGGNHSTIKKLS